MLRADGDDWAGLGCVEQTPSNGAGPCGGANDGPIDRAHLSRYTLGDVQLEREVLALFIEQAPDLLVRLRSARTTREWHMAAHTLKGSARAIGAWRLAKVAEAAEQEGGPGQDCEWASAIETEIGAIRTSLPTAVT